MRFRRERVLIVGCGDVGLRVARRLHPGRPAQPLRAGGAAQPLLPHATARRPMLALSSSPERLNLLRQHGLRPLRGNLDDPATLRRLAGLATRVLHLAPPPTTAALRTDPRTRALAQALARRTPPRALVYGSTSGVYGDCGGDWVAETRTPRPQTDRARRRVDAERTLRRWARQAARGRRAAAMGRRMALTARASRPLRTRLDPARRATGAAPNAVFIRGAHGGATPRGPRVTLLRIPGIYGPGRAGGVRERVQRGTPALHPQDDVYTNHIHADDLARACLLALWRGHPQRALHISDDTDLKAGDYCDQAADHHGLPRPPRLRRAQAQRLLSPMTLSFLSESRRLNNARMKRELRLRLRYPTVREGWAQP